MTENDRTQLFREGYIAMKKVFCCIIIIAIVLSCCGCSAKTQYSSIESTNERTTDFTPEEIDEVHSSEISSSLDATQATSRFEPEITGELDFRCIYRGFTPVPLNDSEMLDRFMNFGEQTIETEEEWNAFMATFCPGIPYDEPWDFSEDVLIAYITGDTSLACTTENTITRLAWENGNFAAEYENDPADSVYAINSEGYTHFYVEVIALSRDSHASAGENKQSAAPEKEASDPNLKTVFRVFAIASFDDRDTFERLSEFGNKVISTEADWNAFLSAFCPDIPCREPVDFTSDCLLVTIMLGAKPTYAGTSRIVGIDQETGFLVWDDDLKDRIYALNTENLTHFYMEVIAVPSEQAPGNLNTWTTTG